jgi:ABC-type bacteriocin/lantibiotic exporter with double-glycine peptidase domain
VQAAIASLHVDEPRDWHEIAALYGELARLTASPVVELNRAVAVAEAVGPEEALRIVDGIALEDYRYLHATRGELLRRLGRTDEARDAFLLAHLGQRIDAEVVMTYHHHLLGLPLGFFAARRTGEIVSRLQDAVRIRTAVGGTGLSIVVDSVTLLITCSVMFWLDWKLMLLAVALLPALLLAIAGLNPGMKRAQQTAMERSASFQAHTVELVDTVETVRASRAEGRMRARGEVALSEVLEASFRSDIYGLWITGAATLLAGISALALLWGGGHAVLSGRMTVGQLMGLYTLFGTVIGPVERLAGANQVIQDALVATGRIGDVLVLGSEAERQTAEASDRRIEGEVAVRGLRFRHAGGYLVKLAPAENQIPISTGIAFEFVAGVLASLPTGL